MQALAARYSDELNKNGDVDQGPTTVSDLTSI
jgi:hypothetical protein